MGLSWQNICLTSTKPWVCFLPPQKWGMMKHACSPSPRRSRKKDQKFKVILSPQAERGQLGVDEILSQRGKKGNLE